MHQQNSRGGRHSRRVLTAALGVVLLVFGLLVSEAAHASVSLPAATQVSGTVKTAGGDPIANACVYPIAIGDYGYTNAGQQGQMSELLPGMCTGSDGTFTVTFPPSGAQTRTIIGFAVAPTYSYIGEIWLSSRGTDIVLRPAEATAYGFVTTESSTGVVPVGNSLVEVLDQTTNSLLGVTVTDSVNGSYLIGEAAAANPSDTVVLGTGYIPGIASASDSTVTIPMGAPVVGSYTTPPTIQLPSSTTVTGSVTVDGLEPLPYQVIGILCHSGCTSSTYAVTDASGNYTFVVPRNAKVQLSAGGRIVDVNTSALTYIVPPIRLVPKGAGLDTTSGGPTTWLTPSAISFTAAPVWTWSGGSLLSGPAGWLRQFATATWHSPLTPYSSPGQGTLQSTPAALNPGSTQCIRIKTVTSDAVFGKAFFDVGAASCQSMPLDDRSLKASGAWKKTKSAKAYAGTLVTATAPKATLSLTGVTGHGLGIVWTRAKVGGTFTVAVNGKVLKSVSTKGAAANRHVTQFATKALKGAKVVITTTSKSPVSIDGLTVLP